MRTSKPIATISYNSQQFLIDRLSELIGKRKISDWIFINHFAEEDERKNHIHLWLKPNTLVDSMEIQKFLTELDPQNPLKPLKCIDFRFASTDDWILYCQHYKPYLDSKFESRQYHYSKDDFVYYDEDSFDDLYNHAFRGSEWARRNQQLEAIRNFQVLPSELILNGSVPLNLTSQLASLRKLQQEDSILREESHTYRNGRPNHD